MHVARSCPEEEQGLVELLLGFDPAAIGLAIGGQHRTIDVAYDPHADKRFHQTAQFGSCLVAQMVRTVRRALRWHTLGLVPGFLSAVTSGAALGRGLAERAAHGS